MRSPTVTPKLQCIAAQAARDPDRVFTTLAHLIDEDFLREAYRHTSKSSAAGIDGVTAQMYAEHLEENLRDLHERLRSGVYQAAPVERVWIEKDDGGRRPIGKPTFEDKIVQRAVAMLLEAIYEQDFSDCSYGFRQGRSPHDLNVARKLRRSFEFIKKQWFTDTIQLRNRCPLRQSTMHLPAAYPRIDLASLLQMEPQRFGIPGRLSLAYHR